MDNLAVYEVNNYLYSQIKDLLNNTNPSFTPIIPIQDQPESNSLTGTYLVYTVSTAPMVDTWWLSVDDVAYLVWNSDLDQIAPVINKMIDLFRREDESAADINTYLESIGHNDFKIHSVRVVGTSSSNPTPDENGRYGQMFNIRYSYTTSVGTGYN